MDDIIGFDYNTILDNRLFYNYLWKKMYNLIFDKEKKYIILDFSDLKCIKAEVLPKLCCLGILAKRKGVKIEININPVSDVKNFLGEIGFFEIVKQNNIFILNEGQIGGNNIPSKVTKAFLCFNGQDMLKKYEAKYTFNEKLDISDKLKYCIEAEIFGENYLMSPGVITDDMINNSSILKVLSEIYNKNRWLREKKLNELGLDFTELIHNAIWHGESLCFFSVQAGVYNNKQLGKRFKRIDFCVADSGMGLYNSLQKKDWNTRTTITMPLEDILLLSTEKDKNFYSILEMIYYRANDIDRGVYDIMKNMEEKEQLTINIINRNLHMFFRREGLDSILQINYRKGIYVCEKENMNYGFSMDISF